MLVIVGFFFVTRMVMLVRTEVLVAVRVAMAGVRAVIVGMGMIMSMPVRVVVRMPVRMLGAVLVRMIMLMLVFMGMFVFVAVLVITFHSISPWFVVTRTVLIKTRFVRIDSISSQETGLAQGNHPAIG